jgi:hypothetical protein
MTTGLVRPSPVERLDAAVAAYRAAGWMSVRHTAHAAELVSPWGPERVLLEVLPDGRARQCRSWAALAEPEPLDWEPQPPPPGTTGQRDEVDREAPSLEERLGLILLMVLGLGVVLLVAPLLLQFIIAVAQGLFGINLDDVGVLLGIRVALLLLIIVLRLVHALRDD